jgi:hypothetical protein
MICNLMTINPGDEAVFQDIRLHEIEKISETSEIFQIAEVSTSLMFSCRAQNSPELKSTEVDVNK